MNCGLVQEELPLFLYDELPAEQRSLIEDHLEECAACRNMVERERALHEVLTAGELAPPPGLLARCRKDLIAEIQSREGTEGVSSRAWQWKSWLRNLSIPTPAWKLAGALTLVAIGFFSARLTQQPEILPGRAAQPVSFTGGLASSEPVLSNIRSVTQGPDGQVQIQVEEVRHRVISGSVEDGRIRELLLETARVSSDPGLRVETVNLLNSGSGMEDVRNALVEVLQHDPNPGVRLKALEGLKLYASDPDVRQAMKAALLKDDNAGVRIQAIELLTQQREALLVPTLQRLLRTEENIYVRQKSENVLRDLNASAEIY
jgi:hypothetical protein